MTQKVFVDADLVLDLLAERHPFHAYAQRLFALAELGKIAALTSPLVVANVHYVLRKLAGGHKAREILRRLRPLLRIVPMNGAVVEMSLASDFADFEDALQYHAALAAKVDVLLTRNVRDFKEAQLPVLTAQEFVGRFESAGNQSE